MKRAVESSSQIALENAIPEKMSAGGITVLTLDVTGKILSVNADFERTSGCSRYAILGRRIADLGDSRDIRLFGILQSALQNAGTRAGVAFHESVEVRGRSAEISVFPVVDSMGCISQFVAVKRDVAVLHRDWLNVHKEAYLDRVGKIVGTLVHHFHHLLIAIMGQAELVIGRLPEGDSARASAEMVVRTGERGTSMIRRLLAFGGRLPLKPVSLDLNALVSGMTQRIERIIRKEIDFETDLAPRLQPVNADPEQLERLLLDLVGNACEAMPDGGRLSIETAMVNGDRPPGPQDASRASGAYVALTVRDDGVGMDAETRSLAFEPFFTTKSSRLGLGLSSAYGFVKQSGGHIRVHGRPGKGAVMTIYLPCEQAYN